MEHGAVLLVMRRWPVSASGTPKRWEQVCSVILSSLEVTMESPATVPEIPGCHGPEVLGRMVDKWSLYVIHLPRGGTKRFSELRRLIDGITPCMLTVTIRSLERDGLIWRTFYSVVPPRVEYALGESLLQLPPRFCAGPTPTKPISWPPATATTRRTETAHSSVLPSGRSSRYPASPVPRVIKIVMIWCLLTCDR